MDRLDRYLRAIRAHLPQSQQEDIIQELSENLRSEMEDRAAALGRPMTEAEQEEFLAQHGNPIVVAARYRQDTRSLAFGRQLIGPELFPFYVRILLINLGVTLAVCVAASIFLAGTRNFEQIFPTVILNLLLQFAIITGIFIAADRRLARNPESWGQGKPAAFWTARAKDEPRERGMDAFSRHFIGKNYSQVPRLVSLCALALNTVAVLWWSTAPRILTAVLDSIDLGFMRLGPAWSLFYLPWLALMIGTLVSPAICLFRPGWVRFRAAARATLHGLMIVVLAVCLRVGDWITLTDAAHAPFRHRDVVYHVNQGLNFGALLSMSILGIMMVLEVWRAARLGPEVAVASYS